MLRWYPRAWREHYGEEFLALIEDILRGRRPGWRLRLGVVRAGLGERFRQAGRASAAAARRLEPAADVVLGRSTVYGIIGFLVAVLPENLRAPVPLARAGQVAAAADAEIAVAVLGGIAVLAGGHRGWPYGVTDSTARSALLC
jgi:hypothetical protein